MSLRLFSDAYGSLTQPLLISWSNPNLTDREYQFRCLLGRMRLDAWLYDKVVLVDADIFDGTFFLVAAELGMLGELPWSRLEIRRRADTLEQSFFRSIRPTEAPTLKRYLFSGVPIDLGARIADGLATTAADECKTFDDIGPLIERYSSSEVADSFSRSWRQLLTLESKGQMKCVKWTGGFPFDQEVANSVAAIDAVLTPWGRDLLAEVLRMGSDRSAVVLRFSEADPFGGPDEVSDIATIANWHHGCYRTAQAKSHGVRGPELLVPAQSKAFDCEFWPGRTLEESSNQISLQVPDDFLHAIGSMSLREWDDHLSGDAMMIGSLASKRGALDIVRMKIEGLVDWLIMSQKLEPTQFSPIDVVRSYGAQVAGGAVAAGVTHALQGVFHLNSTSLSRRTFWSVAAGTFIGAAINTASGETERFVGELIQSPTQADGVASAVVRQEERRRS